MWWSCRVVLSEAVDGCICFTRKIQHGDDCERCRPQGPKNVHNFLMPVRPLSWACGHGIKMLLILKKLFLTWLLPDIFRYASPKKCPTILYAVNLRLKPVSATGASDDHGLTLAFTKKLCCKTLLLNIFIQLQSSHQVGPYIINYLVYLSKFIFNIILASM